MASSYDKSLDVPMWQRRVLYFMLGSITLVLTVNSNDSGLAKLPLLVACTTFIVALLLVHLIQMRTVQVRYSHNDVLVLAFWGLVALSATVYFSPIHTWRSFSMWGGYIICFFAGSRLFPTKQDTRKLLFVITIVTAIVCLIGVVQFFFSDLLIIDFNIGKDRRIASTLGNSSFLGGYIVLVFPLLLSQVLADWHRKTPAISGSFLLIALAFLLIATESRSSIIAFLCSGILFFLLTRQSRVHAFLWTLGIAGFGGLLVFLFFPSLVQRFTTMFAFDSGSTFARRTFFWSAGAKAFFDAPIFGHGIGSFESLVLAHRSPDYWMVKSEDIVPHAHNEFLETSIEMGSIGFLLFASIIILALRQGLKASRQHSGWEHLTATGLICSIIGILVDNLASVSLRQIPVGALSWILLGIISSRLIWNSSMRPREVSFNISRQLSWLPLVAWAGLLTVYTKNQVNILSADAYVRRGIVAGAAQQTNVAIEDYRQAIKADPQNAFAISNLSLEYFKANLFEESVQAARHLQTIYPQYPKAHLIEAGALLSLNRLTEAYISIGKEIQLRSHPEAFYVRALICRRQGNAGEEWDALQDVLRQCMAGEIAYQPEYCCRRLMELATTTGQLQELTTLFTKLGAILPEEQSIRTELALIEEKLRGSQK